MNDLVPLPAGGELGERLRSMADAMEWRADGDLVRAAADRIAELEAESAKWPPRSPDECRARIAESPFLHEYLKRRIELAQPELAAALSRSAALLEKAREALRPFAIEAANFEPTLLTPGGTTITYGDDEIVCIVHQNDTAPLEGCTFSEEITIGDLRAAAALLAEMEK